ncbi:MAG: cellulase family glycosylhydrolase, partial [Lachnospiraceae bacterium]|nr:cellulase family glycosylhydrolase [Lachnospiraceae bacterium]
EVVLSAVYEAWNQVAAETIAAIREITPDAWIVVGGVRYNNVNAVKLLGKPADDRIVYNFHCYEPLVFTHQGAYWVKDMPANFRMTYPDSLENYRKESSRFSEELAGEIYNEAVTGIDAGFFKTIFRPAVEAAEAYDIPLYCGEYGVIDLAGERDVLNWFRDIHEAFEAYGIGRALWNYREKDFGITDSRLDPVRDELQRYF